MIKTIFFTLLLTTQTFSILLGEEAFANKMNEGFTVIDVRTSEEFREGALPGAQNISVTSLSFVTKISKLDKKNPVLIYCKKGGRSARAAVIMKTLGFSTIYELDGGILAWKSVQE